MSSLIPGKQLHSERRHYLQLDHKVTVTQGASTLQLEHSVSDPIHTQRGQHSHTVPSASGIQEQNVL